MNVPQDTLPQDIVRGHPFLPEDPFYKTKIKKKILQDIVRGHGGYVLGHVNYVFELCPGEVCLQGCPQEVGFTDVDITLILVCDSVLLLYTSCLS